MNIYYCTRDFLGFGMEAVVSAGSVNEALRLLEWEVDEDTTEINSRKIGVADDAVQCAWCETSL